MQGNVRACGTLRRLRFKTDTYKFFLSENRPLRNQSLSLYPFHHQSRKELGFSNLLQFICGFGKRPFWRMEGRNSHHQPLLTYILVLFFTWAVDHFFISLSKKLDGAVVRGEVDKCLWKKNKYHLRLTQLCALESK